MFVFVDRFVGEPSGKLTYFFAQRSISAEMDHKNSMAGKCIKITDRLLKKAS